MTITSTAPHDPQSLRYALAAGDNDLPPSAASAVSWGAIVAGAAAAASLSLILLILGVGLGLSSVSPWAQEGISASSFGVSTIVWLTFTQLVSSAMGGFLAGRLRTRWIGAQADEVYFRDTAHGFLAWAVASLVTAALLTSVTGSILNSGLPSGATLAGGVASAASTTAGGIVAPATTSLSLTEEGQMAYFVDSLFRPETSVAGSLAGAASAAEVTVETRDREAAEVLRIFRNVGDSDLVPPEDLQYVSRLVALRTGMSQQESEQRVIDLYARTKARLAEVEIAMLEAADQARIASSYAALWIFVSLLSGAFVASLFATWGGRRRDA
jgi:hypothetical protein